MADANVSNLPPEFVIQRLYAKDISFESPSAPAIFKDNIQPLINFNVQTHVNPLEEDHYEVVLHATIHAKIEDKTIFLIEAQQAGIFLIKHIPSENMPAILNITCPTVLFPYLRELLSDLASRGGFTHFYLAPLNFEALYKSQLEKNKMQANAV